MPIKKHINNIPSLPAQLSHPVWHHILQWLLDLETNHATLEKSYINSTPVCSVHILNINTKIKQHNTNFEAHQKFIDLHYCLKGGEQILLSNTNNLKQRSAYQSSIDTVLYFPPPHPKVINMKPKDLLILFPEDAHLPAQYNKKNSFVHKAVIKIPVSVIN